MNHSSEEHFFLLHYIVHVFKCCSNNYICLKNALQKFSLTLVLTRKHMHLQYQITETFTPPTPNAPPPPQTHTQNTAHMWNTLHKKTQQKTPPASSLSSMNLLSERSSQTHSQVCLCTKNSTTIYCNQTLCMGRGTWGALCVCSYPVVKLLSTLSPPSFQWW